MGRPSKGLIAPGDLVISRSLDVPPVIGLGTPEYCHRWNVVEKVPVSHILFGKSCYIATMHDTMVDETPWDAYLNHNTRGRSVYIDRTYTVIAVVGQELFLYRNNELGWAHAAFFELVA